jgi:hypothetical protein
VSANTKLLTLRVAEAKPRDVGRGIARIDPQDLGKISAEVGDVIQVEGKRKTAAKVMPAYPEDRGKSLIQMDGLLRGNAQVSLDEKVTVQKTSFLPADKMVLNPLTLVRSVGAIVKTHPTMERYVFSGLANRLMLAESDIMTSVLLRLMGLGIPALPVHDSIIAPIRHREAVRQAMEDTYKQHTGFSITVE